MIDADPVAAAVRAVMSERTEWKGTASELLAALEEAAGERIAKSKRWPNGPRALSGRLRRAATFLRQVGIEVTFEREGRARTRIIRITSVSDPAAPNNEGARPSAPSAASAPEGVLQPAVRGNAPKANGVTDADAADATSPKQSGPKETETGGWRASL